ncbi:MAG: hypothetical protein ACLQVD_02500 [Capsulimonadaceae bacterium]
MDDAADFKNVFEALNGLVSDGIIENYAVGGATAVLFYAEPISTYDLDVFVFLPPQESPIISLGPLYGELLSRGYTSYAEHVMMYGTPVQFLVAHNELAEEAVEQARTHDYAGVPVRVIGPEHLIALAIQAGGARRRMRAATILEEAADQMDQFKLQRVLNAYNLTLGVLEGVANG